MAHFFSLVIIHLKTDVVGLKLSNFALHPVINMNIIKYFISLLVRKLNNLGQLGNYTYNLCLTNVNYL